MKTKHLCEPRFLIEIEVGETMRKIFIEGLKDGHEAFLIGRTIAQVLNGKYFCHTEYAVKTAE